MFKTQIKLIPKRPGERLGSINQDNKALTHLGYKAEIDIKDYIKNFISNNNGESWKDLKRNIKNRSLWREALVISVVPFLMIWLKLGTCYDYR